MNEIFKPKLYSILKQPFNKQQFIKDFLAGIVVGIVALPLAIAFGIASGVSPDKGIITAVIAGFLISLLGGSRVQIGGPTGAFIVIVYGIVEQHGINGLIISTIMAGIILLCFGLLKLGSILKYFPHSLIVGFTSAIAIIIFSTQINDALGLSIEKVPSNFLDQWKIYYQSFNNINIAVISITAVTILITVVCNMYFKKVPGSLLSIILITAVVKILNINIPTIETYFGVIKSDISFIVPEIDFSTLHVYFVPAFTIAMLGGIESLLSATVSDGMIGGKHRSNTELIAQGIANIITPFFGGIPATGAIARTATNVKNGGRTPISGIVHALTLLLIMLFFGKWVKLIPMACLAGILMVVAYNMSEWRSFILILKGKNFDRVILLTTFFITLFFDLTMAIQIGIVLSAVLFMKRMGDISGKGIGNVVDCDIIENYSDLPQEVLVYEISGPLFFASARSYSEGIQEIGRKSRILIIRMRHVPFIDQTGLHNLNDALKILKRKGIKIILSGVNDDVKTDLLKFGITELISEKMICDQFETAVETSYDVLNKIK